jgi:hypothetical protein
MRGRAEGSGSAGGGLSGTNVPPPRRAGKAQPNIMDTMEFPTLDNAVTVDSTAAASGGKLTNGAGEK